MEALAVLGTDTPVLGLICSGVLVLVSCLLYNSIAPIIARWRAWSRLPGPPMEGWMGHDLGSPMIARKLAA